MRILIVRTYPDILNIDQYNVQEIGLAKALVNKGHECGIVLYNGHNADEITQVSFDSSNGMRSFMLYRLHGYNILKMGLMPSLKDIVTQYDVIQVHEYEQIMSWNLYRKQIRPTIVYHGLYDSQYTKGYNLKCRVFDNLFFKWFRYDNVVCATKSELAASFMRNKGFKKVHSVGVGLDTQRYDTTVTSNHSNKEAVTLLYIGKIEDRRNSLFLLDVLEELIHRGINLKLKVIGRGTGEYYDNFMSRAKGLIENDYLEYIESMNQNAIANEYVNADLFVFPSKYEIFGMVLLEAMYFGCPLISSYNGGSSELLKSSDGGIIIDDFVVNKWADAIENLLKDSNRRQLMSIKAKAIIKDNYLWDKLADRFIGLYEEALKEE